MKKYLRIALILVMLGASLSHWQSLKWFGLKLVEQGGNRWVSVNETPVVQTAWWQASQKAAAPMRAGAWSWIAAGRGIEYAEVPVLVNDTTVDTLHLARIDRAFFEFKVHIAPEAYRDIDEWADALKSSVVINGSYYERSGYPLTPVRSFGKAMGPNRYHAVHGAFLAKPGADEIVDVKGQEWSTLIGGARHAMISYPLLLDGNGMSRVEDTHDWTANRTFVATDNAHRVILGVSEEGFFSLKRFAEFLKQLPLGLTMALNLDGGPVSGLAIRTKGIVRSVYGRFEVAGEADPKLLTPGIAGKKYPLPIVLAAYPRVAVKP